MSTLPGRCLAQPDNWISVSKYKQWELPWWCMAYHIKCHEVFGHGVIPLVVHISVHYSSATIYCYPSSLSWNIHSKHTADRLHWNILINTEITWNTQLRCTLEYKSVLSWFKSHNIFQDLFYLVRETLKYSVF